MRPSFQELPSWLSAVSEVPRTPVRAHAPPLEPGLFRRTLGNSRLSLHVGLLAVALGLAAAVAAGSVRARYTAESRAEMSAFAQRKLAELRAFETLRAAGKKRAMALAVGGSLVDDVPGYFDVVDGTDGRRFQRRWVVEADRSGTRRIAVRVLPMTPGAGEATLDLASTLPPR